MCTPLDHELCVDMSFNVHLKKINKHVWCHIILDPKWSSNDIENTNQCKFFIGTNNILRIHRTSNVMPLSVMTLAWVIQSSWGQHGAHLGPVGPRWAPCWSHEPCYQGCQQPGMTVCNDWWPEATSRRPHKTQWNIPIFILSPNRERIGWGIECTIHSDMRALW